MEEGERKRERRERLRGHTVGHTDEGAWRRRLHAVSGRHDADELVRDACRGQ